MRYRIVWYVVFKKLISHSHIGHFLEMKRCDFEPNCRFRQWPGLIMDHIPEKIILFQIILIFRRNKIIHSK